MIRFRMISRRAYAAAVLALALAACAETTGPLPRAGVPDDLAFTLSGYGAGSTSVHLLGGTVTVKRFPWNLQPGMQVDSVVVVPTAEAWAEFWTAVDESGVHRWRRTYHAEGVADGAGWGLRLAGGGVVVQTQGSNAYPDRDGREHEMEMTPEFRAFLDALGTLTGWEM